MYKPINCLLVLLFFSSVHLSAQGFKWSGELPEIEKSGFYQVLINPSVTSKLENGFGDVRIVDNDGGEAPYILKNENALVFNDYFVEYPIIEKKEETKWPYYTRLVIHNKKKATISNIQLLIKNSDVTKKLKLSGSDDRENWYVIKDEYRFHSMYSGETTSIIKIINFPLSNYEYFEIVIDDWKNNPVNILKAGYFNSSVEEGKFTKVEGVKISQLEKEEDNESVVKIVFDGQPQLDRLTLKVTGPEFYYRNAEIQLRDSSRVKNRHSSYHFTVIDEISISSNSLNTFQLNGIRTNTLYLRIKNKDNEPLKIEDVKAEQLNAYLVAKLEKSKDYQVVFGNEQVDRPEYDLQYFMSEIPEKLPQLTVNKIKRTKTEDKEASQEKGVHLNSLFIWLAIILVIAFLLYMVVKMLNDMKQKQ